MVPHRAAYVLAALFLAAPVAAQQSSPTLRLVQELRIDGAAADFSGVGSVAIGRNGEIIFVEPQDFRLRFYDATGKETSRFGRRGQGPGEFGVSSRREPVQADVRVGVMGDTVWTFDRTLRRFTLISMAGKLIRTVPQPNKLPSFSGNERPEPGTKRKLLSFDSRAIFPDGSAIGWVLYGHIDIVKTSKGADVPMQRTSDRGYAIASVRGDVTRVIATTPLMKNFINVERMNGLQSWGTSIPFVEGVYETMAPDGTRIAYGVTTFTPDHTGSLRITVIGLRGDTLVARNYPFAGVPISARVADSAIAVQMRSYRPAPDSKMRPNAPPDVADEIESKLRAGIPPAASPYRSLLLGIDYSLWLSGPSAPTGRQYFILDEHGTPLGTVTLPKNSYIAAASRTTVWTVEDDANDLPSLVRYRIVK